MVHIKKSFFKKKSFISVTFFFFSISQWCKQVDENAYSEFHLSAYLTHLLLHVTAFSIRSLSIFIIVVKNRSLLISTPVSYLSLILALVLVSSDWIFFSWPFIMPVIFFFWKSDMAYQATGAEVSRLSLSAWGFLFTGWRLGCVNVAAASMPEASIASGVLAFFLPVSEFPWKLLFK